MAASRKFEHDFAGGNELYRVVPKPKDVIRGRQKVNHFEGLISCRDLSVIGQNSVVVKVTPCNITSDDDIYSPFCISCRCIDGKEIDMTSVLDKTLFLPEQLIQDLGLEFGHPVLLGAIKSEDLDFKGELEVIGDEKVNHWKRTLIYERSCSKPIQLRKGFMWNKVNSMFLLNQKDFCF